MNDTDYNRAAIIAQDVPRGCRGRVIDAFVELFCESPGFDVARFRTACDPRDFVNGGGGYL